MVSLLAPCEKEKSPPELKSKVLPKTFCDEELKVPLMRCLPWKRGIKDCEKRGDPPNKPVL